jgi:hypothetical protein
MEVKIKRLGGSLVIIVTPDMQDLFKFKENEWYDIPFEKAIKLRREKQNDK